MSRRLLTLRQIGDGRRLLQKPQPNRRRESPPTKTSVLGRAEYIWTNTGTLPGDFTPAGGPTVANVDGVTAVTFDGVDDYFLGPTTVAGLEGNSDMSIEVWVHNPSILDEETMVAWGHRGGVPDGSNMGFGYGSSAPWGAVSHWGSTDLGWNGAPETNKWHHLVYTYDGAIQRVYADGVEKNSSDVAAVLGPLAIWAGDNIRLGTQVQGDLTTNVLFGGLSMAQVRVQDGVLSAADVENNYSEGLGALFGTVNMSGFDVTVASDSTFSPVSAAPVSVGSLTLENGIIRLTGTPSGIGFGSTTVDAAAGAVVGFNLDVPLLDTGPIDVVNPTQVTIVKDGPADMVLTAANVGASGFGNNVTFETRQGRLIGLHGSNPFDEARLTLNGGEVVLSVANPGVDEVTFDNLIRVENNSTLTAGAGDGLGRTGSSGVPLVHVGSSPGNGVVLNNGTLTLRSTDGYALDVAGPLVGSGDIEVPEGDATLSGGGSAGLLTVNGGTLNTAADLSATQLKVLGGTVNAGADILVQNMTVVGGTVNTGVNRVVVSQDLKLGQPRLSISPGDTFSVSSDNLLDRGDITLSGGTLTLDNGQSLAIADELLVNLSAAGLPGGLITDWANTGSIVGDFGAVGAPVVETVTDSNGLAASAVRFSGDNYFQGPTSVPSIEGNEPRSIEVWVHNLSFSAEETTVAWGHRGGPTGSNMSFRYNDDGSWGAVSHWAGTTADMGWGGNNNETGTPDPATPPAGQWHHLVYTYDGQVARVYADGVFKNDRSDFGALTTHPGDPIRIAADNTVAGGGEAFSFGSLDIAAIRIHDGTLSPDEIQTNFDAGITLDPTAGMIDMPDHNLRVEADSALELLNYQDSTLGDLTLTGGVTLDIQQANTYAMVNVNNFSPGDGSTVEGNLFVRGTINVGSSPGTATLLGMLEMDEGPEDGSSPTEAGLHVDIAGDQHDMLQLDGSFDVASGAYIAGSLSVAGLSPRTNGGNATWGDAVLTVMEVIDPGSETGLLGEFGELDGTSIPLSYGVAGTAPNEGDYLGAGIWFGNASDDPTGESGVYYTSMKVDIGVFQAAPGDTDGNRKVEGQDILNILQAGLFGDGVTTAANWGNGDFNADGKISGEDILALLGTGLFGDGTYPDSAAAAAGAGVKLVVTGDGLLIDAGDATVTGFVLSSKSGILTGDDAESIGLFQEDTDATISGAFAMTLKGEHALGDVIGETDVDLTSDLSLVYTLAGQPGIFTASVVVPEPGTLLLLLSGLAGLLIWRRRM